MSIGNYLRPTWKKVAIFFNEYPIARGIVSYAVVWPLGSWVQQTIEGYEKYDYGKILRFSVYGAFYVAPSLTVWMTVAQHMFPQNNLRTALTRALFEQVSYTPFAMISFYFFMTLLEGKTLNDAKEEILAKLPSTYKVGACVWPVLQTINHTLIAEKNRIVYVSICSLMWTSFLAYMKHKDKNEFSEYPQKPLQYAP